MSRCETNDNLLGLQDMRKLQDTIFNCAKQSALMLAAFVITLTAVSANHQIFQNGEASTSTFMSQDINKLSTSSSKGMEVLANGIDLRKIDGVYNSNVVITKNVNPTPEIQNEFIIHSFINEGYAYDHFIDYTENEEREPFQVTDDVEVAQTTSSKVFDLALTEKSVNDQATYLFDKSNKTDIESSLQDFASGLDSRSNNIMTTLL